IGAAAKSTHLQWMIVRNCSNFLKRNKQTYSAEPNNLKARNSFRYNGLIHSKTVGVQPTANGKGSVVVVKRRSSQTSTAPSAHGGHPQGQCHPSKPVVVKTRTCPTKSSWALHPRSNKESTDFFNH
uniref:Large ribosomal subunit protein eL28 n=1 Tax=Peromyscus maniculatus bairdii TaxID=230844 RepID=A0A8C8W5P8_PERMB